MISIPIRYSPLKSYNIQNQEEISVEFGRRANTYNKVSSALNQLNTNTTSRKRSYLGRKVQTKKESGLLILSAEKIHTQVEILEGEKGNYINTTGRKRYIPRQKV